MVKNKHLAVAGTAALFLYTVLFQLASDDDRAQLKKFVHKNFGKTHFIVGYPHEKEVINTYEPDVSDTSPLNTTSAKEYSFDMSAFFSPYDDVRKEMIERINNEKKSIHAAVFVFTDEAIAQALIQAQRRGIIVEVITDPSCLKERHNKIGLLADAGIPIFIYNPAKQSNTGIMHHKFAIFGKNKDKKSWLWTGSFNFTRSACQSNHENVLITSNEPIINKYKKSFLQLKEKTFMYSVHPTA